jgi:hypothetical protein
VAGLGGDPDAIPPSPRGAPLRGKELCDDVVEHCGRVEEIVFDCHGRIERFRIADCLDRHTYVTRDQDLAELILRAQRDRLDVRVVSPRHRSTELLRIIVHG